MDELRNVEDDLTETLERAINSASRYIDRYKGRDFFFHNHTEIPESGVTTEEGALTLYGGMQDGTFYRHFLTLPYNPIIELTSLTVNGTAWTESVDFVRQATRLVAINGVWPVKYRTDSVVIVGQFGYAQETRADIPDGLPADIVRAAILIAAAFSGHNQKQIVGVDGNPTSVTDKNIPKAALDILGSRAMVI